MWKNLYDSLLQWLTSIPWAQFLQQYGAIGKTVRDKFQHTMYSYSGIYLLLFTVSTCILYYYYLNAKFGNYYSRKSYYLNMFFNSLLIGGATFITGKVLFGEFFIPTTSHVIWLSIINSCYGAILFFIFSIIIKWKSPMGKRTPF